VCIETGVRQTPTNLPSRARWCADRRMRLVLATKREVDMSERKLMFLMSQEQAEAFAGLLEAAERGDGAAAGRLGDMYREGLEGLRYSPKETHRWYAKSALMGNANGQCNLGACYEHGLGCAQSYVKAVKWYRLSAAQGLGTASMNLGYCYLSGHGVPVDKAEALRLFREAVERGEERAAHEVERLEETPGLRRLQPVPSETCSGASRSEHSPADTQVDAPLPAVAAPPQPSNVRWIRRIRFVDETQPGTHLGLGGVEPPQCERAPAASGNATEEELLPIFAECGMTPSDFIEETAERYAEYLLKREEGKP